MASKWHFLNDEIKTLLGTKLITKAEIARLLIKKHNLECEGEELRRYIVKLVYPTPKYKSVKEDKTPQISREKELENVKKFGTTYHPKEVAFKPKLTSPNHLKKNFESPGLCELIKDENNIPFVTKKELNSDIETSTHPSGIEFNYKSASTKQPKQSYEEYKWINDVDGMHILLGCVHIPFENKYLFDAILKLISDNKDNIRSINILGDFIDCNSLSSHDKGRFTAIPGLTLDKEYEEAEHRLEQLYAATNDNTTINYVYGNHDLTRIERFNSDVQNSKTPVPLFEDYIAKEFYRVKFHKESVTIGNFELLHGIYYNEHCAKKHLDTFRKSMVFVHTHRIQSWVENNIESHNIGWLGDINSPAFNYADRGMKSKWRNGFGILHTQGAKEYFEQIICTEKNFIYGGKLYGSN